MNVRAYIALGSNLGDRMSRLQSACRELGTLGRVAGVSRVYETAPVGNIAQGPFLNAVAALDTEMEATALLDALKDIETRLGRQARERWGPREIDLDLLLLGNEARTTAPLLPHPALHERAFVLKPLADLAPDLPLPGRGTVCEVLAGLSAEGLQSWPEELDYP
jgi:2-amino-4-hydroxy-6-hydroxymethyldihydropteridine diphosphokinase